MPAIDGVSKSLTGMDSDVPNRTPSKELSPDNFMTLFLAQLKNQNPLQPKDSANMLQEMSAMSSITASKDMQKSLKELAVSINATMGNTQVLQATQLIGKKVEIASGISPLVENEGLTGSIMLPQGHATAIKVTIKDQAGKIVKVIDLPAPPVTTGGLVDFKWDGLDSDGKPAKPDFYSISGQASISGQSVDLATAGSFKVNSVALNPKTGSVFLNLDGMGGVDMGQIIKIL